MQDGQFIAVDFGDGVGKRLQVHDAGNGKWTASNPADGDTVLSFEPRTNRTYFDKAGSTGEYQQFTASGNVMCFYSAGQNPAGAVRLIGFVEL